MSAQRKPMRRNNNMSVWQALFCLTVISFLLRSFIPAGYMPDLSGAQGRAFTITLCTMAGVQTQQVDLSDGAAKSLSGDSIGSQDCPYGLVASQALISNHHEPLLAGTIAYRPVVLAAVHRALPPLPSLGPPLGSRAPPSYLG